MKAYNEEKKSADCINLVSMTILSNWRKNCIIQSIKIILRLLYILETRPKSKNQYHYGISLLDTTSIQIKEINIKALRAMNVTRLMISNYLVSYISVNKQTWYHECSIFWHFVIFLSAIWENFEMAAYAFRKYVDSM